MEFNPSMVPALREGFEDFLKYIKIDSKETGGATPLELYNAQSIALDTIFDGLAEDKHRFVFLKARQLGITTVMLALDIFWISVFPGIQGAIIFDTEETKEGFRTLIERMLDALPASHRVPVVKNNRTGIVLRNGSSVAFLVAGKRKNNQLGRGKGLNFVHATEVAFWGDEQAVETMQKSLAQRFPARLFVFESTANGFNLYNSMWKEAKVDDLNQVARFIGWWAKEEYSVAPNSPMMLRYGSAPPNELEREKIEIVREEYGHEVTMEQLAWYRHQKDPAADPDTLDVDVADDSILEQEYPWHEEEAFIMTGAAFFSSREISAAMKKATSRKYKGYRYLMGEQFHTISMEQVRVARLAQLKIFEEPVEGATYVIGADPAFGSSDTGDRFCIQVCRVWADGIDQVAEYCVRSIKTYQFAWIICHLCGVYRNARLLLELNGPGDSVANELKNMQFMAAEGLIKNKEGLPAFQDIFSQVRKYLYHRIDSAGGGYSYHWKTSGANKVSILNQLRDNFSLGTLQVHSVEALEEMIKIVQDGDTIKGEGTAKDDRVIALALSVRAWLDGERRRLQSEGKTKEFEERRRDAAPADIQAAWSQGIVANFFADQNAVREAKARADRRAKSRWR